ncbi:hypothetical protein [Stenotrophomonas sp. SY1]|uniref:hypothetical protein n=1 Tax=Stenotrophomonas sp. SY1 TaxID=477235 RepID=UPI001E3E8B71|nr:hypothetical protein [Stenotrophomonas sp. SY1]MCD9087463.1 hypothetical protein [Stenotrophomonas sp. SY1]
MKKLLIAPLLLALAACSQGLDGTYSDQLGMVDYVFAPDGTVTVQMLGTSQQTTYTRQDDTLHVVVPEAGAAPLEFSIEKDGALLGPMGVRLVKVER